jgi:hypothetical protein
MGSANRKSAKFHIHKRSENHQTELRFSKLISQRLSLKITKSHVWNLLQCWPNVLHHEIFLNRCFWSGIFWCHFLWNFYFTWKRMQKGNLSKINPALIGIDTSDLGYGGIKRGYLYGGKSPPPLQNVIFLHLCNEVLVSSVKSQLGICKGVKHGRWRDGPWIFHAIHVISVNFK